MNIKSNLDENELLELLLSLQKQLNIFFFVSKEKAIIVKQCFQVVLNRIMKYFAEVSINYFVEKELVDKLYCLNKITHPCDIHHEIFLTESLCLEHPVETVSDTTKYGNNITLAANSYIKNTIIPDTATVFRQSPNLTIKYL